MRALVRAPTKADRKHARPSRSAFGWMALVLLPGAVMAAVAPEMLRVAFGWPLNHACYPPVVGPGDTTRIYTRQKIHSVKGYWRAQPEVVIAARREGGEPWLIPASGETNQNDWGSSITVSSGAKSQVSSPWVEVSLPTENSLGGQEVRCDIHLQVEYPQIDGYSTFHDETRSIDYSVPLALAPARAGMIYNGFWWLSTLFSVGTISAAALLIGRGARSLKRMANPTRVYALDRERETMSDPIPNQGSTMAPRATPAEAPPPADPGKPRKVSRFSPALVVGVIAGLLFVGFTMMVALGVLMAVLGGAWLAMLQEGNVDATKLTIGKVSQALELYGAKHKGRYPSTEEGLGAASRYMTDGRVPTDAWGHPLQYFSPSIHRPGLSFEVVSLGRDGQPGGDGPDADIYSWDLD